MTKIRKVLFALLIGLLNFNQSFSQSVEMADDFRGEGKIYVVIAVVLFIISGMFFLLFRIEKRLKKIEKQKEN